MYIKDKNSFIYIEANKDHWEPLANLRVTINLSVAVYEHVYSDWEEKKKRMREKEKMKR